MIRPGTVLLVALLSAGCSDPETDHLAGGGRAVLHGPGDGPVVVCVREGGPRSISGCREVPVPKGTRVIIIDDGPGDVPRRSRLRLVRLRIEGGDHAGLECEVGRGQLRAIR